MSLTPRLRRLVLAAHVVSGVGWIGAVAAYLALVAAALTSEDPETVRSAFVAMELTYLVLVPLAIASLLSGLVQSLGTSWGLLRHYWVILKLLLTGPGLGLGLSIAASVARAHGGRLVIEPLKRGGLRVSVRLPAALASRAERSPAPIRPR